MANLKLLAQWATVDQQIESVLRRRGHVVVREGHVEDLFPGAERAIVDESRIELLAALGKASFRKVLRKALKDRGDGVPVQELRQIAGESVADYVRLLVSIGLAREPQNGRLRLDALDNIGLLLEWYVARARLFEAELR
jgi:hypothetical protein